MSLVHLVDEVLKNVEYPNRNWFDTKNYNMCLYPNVDLYTVDNGLELKAELPGVDKSDINVVVENNVLILSGKYKKVETTDSSKYYYEECNTGSFNRKIKLPFCTEPSNVTASFTNGVLTVNITKLENFNAGNIKIE